MINKYSKKWVVYLFAISLILEIAIFSLGHFLKIYLIHNEVTIIITIAVLLSAFFLFNKKKIVMYVYKLIIILLAVLCLIGIVLSPSNKNFYFKLPKKTYTVIIEECSFLLGGWSNIYLKKYEIFKKPIQEHVLDTDNGYLPFTYKNYKIKWLDEDTFNIEYKYRSGDNIWKDETFYINQ